MNEGAVGAVVLYADADYKVIESAGHGFYGADQRRATGRAAGFATSYSTATR